MSSNDRYEIDILRGINWKVLRYCKTINEVCVAIKSVRNYEQCKIRVLENNNILAFINDDDYSLFYFLQQYEYYENYREMIQDMKMLKRYNDYKKELK